MESGGAFGFESAVYDFDHEVDGVGTHGEGVFWLWFRREVKGSIESLHERKFGSRIQRSVPFRFGLAKDPV